MTLEKLSSATVASISEYPAALGLPPDEIHIDRIVFFLSARLIFGIRSRGNGDAIHVTPTRIGQSDGVFSCIEIQIGGTDGLWGKNQPIAVLLITRQSRVRRTVYLHFKIGVGESRSDGVDQAHFIFSRFRYRDVKGDKIRRLIDTADALSV